MYIIILATSASIEKFVLMLVLNLELLVENCSEWVSCRFKMVETLISSLLNSKCKEGDGDRLSEVLDHGICRNGNYSSSYFVLAFTRVRSLFTRPAVSFLQNSKSLSSCKGPHDFDLRVHTFSS